MKNGTKKLFPTDYEAFKTAMFEAAEMDEFPIMLEVHHPEKFTFKDFQELIEDFRMDTGFNMEGHFCACTDCGKLHVFVEVDYLDIEQDEILQ